MLRLILGRAGTGKTGQVMEEIRGRVETRQGTSVLIVPEQYSHEAERELARQCGDALSLYAEVLSFTRLAARAAEEAGGSAREYVDAGGRLLRLALALDQVGGNLEIYGTARRQPEGMVQLLQALDELRSGRAGPGDLRRAAAEAGPVLGAKLRDLALLQEAMAALEARSGADPASRMDILAQDVPRCPFLRGAQVYVDGFTDFTAQERRVLRELWMTAGDVTVCLGCDSLQDGSEVFSLSRRTACSLRDEALRDGVGVRILLIPSRRDGTAMGFLEKNLFSWTEETFPAGGTVRLRSAHSAAAECEMAAAEARRLVRETGCRWRDIAVAVRGFDDYRSALEAAFRRYEIPLYASARRSILSHPLPLLTSSAFEIVTGGWSYESMFTYLKTGLAGVEPPDRDELENYVLLWSLRGSAWTREAPWQQHPEGYGGKPSPDSDAALRRLDALRRAVAAPLARLERQGRQAATAAGQCQALADFWEDIHLAGRLEDRAAALAAAGRDQAAAEYRQLWDLMVSALEQCHQVLGDMPMDQGAFARLFSLMLTQYDVGTIPVALDRVTAGDFHRMRRRNIRHLLILGASDDRLPRPQADGGVFTDLDRDLLRELDLDLPGGDDLLDREFNLIYNVLTLPSDSLYMSRPAYAGDGSETRPSFVMERVARLFALGESAGSLAKARSWASGGVMELACAGDPAAAAYCAGDPDRLRRLEELRAAAAFARGRLGREAVRNLYGNQLRLTASRCDTFASCRFQYFLRYGLKAKPRQPAGFDPPELGTFLHFLLERVARDVEAEGGFAQVSDQRVTDLTDRYVAQYVHTELEDFREKSPRFIYLFRRLTESARRIVLDTAGELRRSDFRPLDFELNFSDTADMPPVTLGRGEEELTLTGVADRVDGWEHDGKLYLRVVDYKSGKKSFFLTDVWYGMGLQMLLYLFALEKTGQAHYGRTVLPAGILYVPARDVLVPARERLSDEEIVKKKAAQARRSGLLLRDEAVLAAMEHGPELRYLPVRLNRAGEYAGDALATAQQLGELSRHVEGILTRMAGELRRGSIAADPWFFSEGENTCLYCDYYDACRFDEKADGWRYRTRLKAPEFWEKLAAGGRPEEREDEACR